MSAEAPLILVPYGEDPLPVLAAQLIARHRAQLPDLTRHAVLFPTATTAQGLRTALLTAAAGAGYGALLPPHLGTIESYLARYTTQAGLSTAARELRLFRALRRHAGLAPEGNAWALIDSLLPLFDELTLCRTRLPADADQLARWLADQYRIRDHLFPPLLEEARTLHGLWRAWSDELAQERHADPAQALAQAAARVLAELGPDAHIYIAGHIHLPPLLSDWLRQLIARGQATVFAQGDAVADGLLRQWLGTLGLASAPATAPAAAPGRTALIEAALHGQRRDLATRAAERHAAGLQPPGSGLRLVETADAEEEARVIDVAIRRAWIGGARSMAVVTSDRKLARRLRALLERAGLPLSDAAGWPLSTTSAATALERWLELIETDFHHRPLLDFLRLPFLAEARDTRQRLTALLEHGLLQPLRLRGGLGPIARALGRAPRALAEAPAEDRAALEELIARLGAAARPLRAPHAARSTTLAGFVAALMESLEALGLADAYAQDAAGRELLQVLAELRAVARHDDTTRLSWFELRRLLARALERRSFRPTAAASGVQLLGFEESRLGHYEYVIVAAATADRLPGAGAAQAFFNDTVRRALQLPDADLRRAAALHDFRRLLEAAPHTLVTWRRTEQGQPCRISPWVERLRSFARLAVGEDLGDAELLALARHPEAQIEGPEPVSLAPAAAPRRALPAALLPATLSASAYQRLLDCPYRYYATDGLALTEPEALEDELTRGEYGERVHRIFEAFHKGVAGLPGPAPQPVTAAARPEARALLTRLAEVVFAEEIAERYTSRAWLHRFLGAVDTYLDWLVADPRWRLQEAEATHESDLPGIPLRLKGRIDRIDAGPEGLRIVDYKTGAAPKLTELRSGEAVQLPFYALLCDPDGPPVAESLYCRLERDATDTTTRLERDELATLSAAHAVRLRQLGTGLAAGTPLPAWGDDTVCGYCGLHGLCRRDFWQETTGPDP